MEDTDQCLNTIQSWLARRGGGGEDKGSNFAPEPWLRGTGAPLEENKVFAVTTNSTTQSARFRRL